MLKKYVRSCSDWSKWEEVMQKELDTLENAHTWTVVKCSPNINVIGCKWVLWIKCNANSKIDKYKARLVAKGYSQVYSVNYYDTYAPVARLASLCTILTITTRNNWDIDVFDFQSAFLNRKLDADEVIYMQLP